MPHLLSIVSLSAVALIQYILSVGIFYVSFSYSIRLTVTLVMFCMFSAAPEIKTILKLTINSSLFCSYAVIQYYKAIEYLQNTPDIRSVSGCV